MFTECVLNVSLKRETPKNVIEILEYLANSKIFAVRPDLPHHKFFTLPRWEQVLTMSSYYFCGFSYAQVYREGPEDGPGLSCRFDMKNYSNEIGEFINWLMPYVEAYPGTLLGYTLYEDDDIPTLIRKVG